MFISYIWHIAIYSSRPLICIICLFVESFPTRVSWLFISKLFSLWKAQWLEPKMFASQRQCKSKWTKNISMYVHHKYVHNMYCLRYLYLLYRYRMFPQHNFVPNIVMELNIRHFYCLLALICCCKTHLKFQSYNLFNLRTDIA